MAKQSADDRRQALARGARAEARVAELLAERGWRILDRNWRGGGGELDIVVEQHGRLRFVEVKLREPGDPVGLEAVDERKRRRLVSAARAWLNAYDDLWVEACFMVVLVEGLSPDAPITWLDDAFDA